jgi:hypothetical protein
MAEANSVIAHLGQQVAQLSVDKAILDTELAELRTRLEAHEVIASGEAVAIAEVAE